MLGDTVPAPRSSAIQPEQFATFGQLLRFPRSGQRSGLTQRELSIAVSYSESRMSRLEQNQRAPDEAALAARFVPALHLDNEPAWAARLLELGAASRAEGRAEEPAPAGEAPLSPNNLPIQLTSFIGRDAELAEVRQLVESGTRLLTLTGPGGGDKTRLALEAAAGLLADFPDGVWWVELAPITDPTLIPQTVASVLGVREEPDRPLLATLTDHLRRKRVLLILDNCEHLVQACALLVLDNCEHLIQACAELCVTLLRSCQGLAILATSREALGVPGETLFPVPTLSVPGPHPPMSVGAVSQFEAVRLFVDRAQAARTGFKLTHANAPAIAQICRGLDGHPLALELAAARVRAFQAEEIAQRLDDRFQLLRGGSRTALPRHQTLEALIGWSYDLLPDRERVLLRRLAVFWGGCTLATAQNVCAGDALTARAVPDLLSQLVNKSLVGAEHEDLAATRYRLLETVRQYAFARLVEAGEVKSVQQRHAAYYLTLSESATSETFFEVARSLEREYDNLRAALSWSLTPDASTETGLRLLNKACGIWQSTGHWSEAQLYCTRALSLPDATQYPQLAAETTDWLGLFAAFQGDYAAAQAHFARSLKLFEMLGSLLGQANALHDMGWAAREQGDVNTARLRFEESLRLFRQAGERVSIGATLNSLGEVAVMEENAGRAATLLEEALAVNRANQADTHIGWSLNHLGHVAQLQGQFERAAQLHQESLPHFRLLGPRTLGTAQAYEALGETALGQQDGASATTYLNEALQMFQDIGDRTGIVWSLAGLAGAAALHGDEPERAVQLWGASAALGRALQTRPAPASHATRERLMAGAREQLGPEAFAAAWAHGARLTLEQAVELAPGDE